MAIGIALFIKNLLKSTMAISLIDVTLFNKKSIVFLYIINHWCKHLLPRVTHTYLFLFYTASRENDSPHLQSFKILRNPLKVRNSLKLENSLKLKEFLKIEKNSSKFFKEFF